jgi:WXG100 protein secretion system (Wss), protein YukD
MPGSNPGGIVIGGEQSDPGAMGQNVDLTIVKTTSNTTEQVSMPATVATGRIIGRLLELWQLPDVGPDGQPLSYGFEHSHGGRQISVDETLADAGVRDNDVLHLVATPTPPDSSRGTEIPASLSAATPVGSIAPTAVRAALSTVYPAYGDRRTDYGPRDAALPRRRELGLYTLALAIVALAAVGIGVLFATGALSGGSRASVKSTLAQVTGASPAAETPSTPVSLTESERVHDRGIIMGLLTSYREDYSTHNVSALSGLFTSGITRHGLAAGGCRVSHGRSAVIASYQSQFEKGSGTYSLVGLSEAQIQLDTTKQAHLNTHYRITPGGTGYVNFRFAEEGEGWKISEVYATCE